MEKEKPFSRTKNHLPPLQPETTQAASPDAASPDAANPLAAMVDRIQEREAELKSQADGLQEIAGIASPKELLSKLIARYEQLLARDNDLFSYFEAWASEEISNRQVMEERIRDHQAQLHGARMELQAMKQERARMNAGIGQALMVLGSAMSGVKAATALSDLKRAMNLLKGL